MEPSGRCLTARSTLLTWASEAGTYGRTCRRKAGATNGHVLRRATVQRSVQQHQGSCERLRTSRHSPSVGWPPADDRDRDRTACGENYLGRGGRCQHAAAAHLLGLSESEQCGSFGCVQPAVNASAALCSRRGPLPCSARSRRTSQQPSWPPVCRRLAPPGRPYRQLTVAVRQADRQTRSLAGAAAECSHQCSQSALSRCSHVSARPAASRLHQNPAAYYVVDASK